MFNQLSFGLRPVLGTRRIFISFRSQLSRLLSEFASKSKMPLMPYGTGLFRLLGEMVGEDRNFYLSSKE